MTNSKIERIGSYRLISLVRAGHVCEIWKVQRVDDAERLALKLLPRGPRYTRENLAYLKREYLVGHGLDHEHIIRVYDFGTTPQGSYVVMEYFPHLNLKQRITSLGVEKLSAVAPRIIRHTAEALEYFHQHGWIHCDIKPDNFLVDEAGAVKLIDFSLAQRRRGPLGRLFAGKVKIQGTKSYMSPEQIRGKPVDERSDVYSLGCMVHELLGGKPPFTGASVQELLTKHLRSAPPSLVAVNRQVHPAFADLVGRMIAKDPARRPESMRDVLDALSGTPVLLPPPPASTRSTGSADPR